jgi:hypothetical protein
MKRFVIRALIVVAAILGMVLAQGAPASATPTKKLASILGASWTKQLQTPADQSIFGSGALPESGCVDLGGTLAPGWLFTYTGERSCTVKPGTKIFVSASSFECSTVPGDDHPQTPPPFTEADLQKCATDLNLSVSPTAPKVTLDGRPVTITEVVTSAQHIVLPENNIFGADPNPPEGYLSAAHGWVALLNPLTPGTHEIKILINEGKVFPENTTTIVVKPGH